MLRKISTYELYFIFNKNVKLVNSFKSAHSVLTWTSLGSFLRRTGHILVDNASNIFVVIIVVVFVFSVLL